jgi:hypothetical protein
MKEYSDSLFQNKLFGPAGANHSAYGFHIGDILDDPNTLYSHNNFGYRSKFWDGSHEILAIGCSQTYGRGIPEEGRWTDILQELTNKKVANLSAPGQSINFLVSQAFAYFKAFGNPEYVVCLFPDPFRIGLPTNEKLIDSKKNLSKSIHTSVQIDPDETADDRPKYLKKPYYYEDVIPVELPIFFSIQSIHALEQYCNSNKINLIWSSWDHFFYENLLFLDKNHFNNFFADENLWIEGSRFNRECHSEYKERFDYYFVHGRDTLIPTSTHPGVHKNIHFAEAFYKEINKKTKQ